TPEFTQEWEVGFDLEFWKRRVALEVSLYDKYTSDILTDVRVPVSSGYQDLRTNLGAMDNKGIELGLTLVPVQNSNLKWTLTTLFTKNVNRVTELMPGLDRVQLDANEVAYIIPGQAFGVFYGSKFARDD